MNLRVERTKPYGLKFSPEGALLSQRGDLFPRTGSLVVKVQLAEVADEDHPYSADAQRRRFWRCVAEVA